MRVVTWNLGNRRSHDEAWVYLRTTMKIDIALLQEVQPPKLVQRSSLAQPTKARLQLPSQRPIRRGARFSCPKDSCPAPAGLIQH